MEILVKGNLDHKAYDEAEEKLSRILEYQHRTNFKNFILKGLQQEFMSSLGKNPQADKELLDLINDISEMNHNGVLQFGILKEELILNFMREQAQYDAETSLVQ